MSNPTFTSIPLASHEEGIPASPEGRLSERLLILILSAFALALYTVTIGYDFVYDDPLLIKQNPFVDSFHYLREIFTQDFWAFQGPQRRTGYYRPLVMLTLLVEKRLFGLQPQYFHFVNIILNALVVALCYRLGKLLWPKGREAFWGALLFAALPVHIEVVSPISGLSDLECGIFMLLGAIVYVRFQDADGPKAWLAGGLVGGLFFLGALTKEIALLLPALLIFYEHAMRPGGQAKPRAALARYGPMLVLAGVYLVIRDEVFGALVEIRHLPHPGLKVLVASALMLLGKYIFVLVWPQKLTCYENFHPPGGWSDVTVLLGGVTILLGALAFVRAWKGRRNVSFAILWFFLTLAPVLDYRLLGVSAYGERYLFVPSMAFCWLAGAGLEWLAEGRTCRQGVRRFVAASIPGIIVGLMALRTAVRLRDFRDELTLDLATVRTSPDSGVFLMRLGNIYRAQKDYARAREAYVAAIAMDPRAEAFLNLGAVLMDQGESRGARFLLQHAARVDPGFAEAYYAWGLVEMHEGNRELADRLLRRAVELNPNHARALNDLGVLVMSQGKLDEAEHLFRRTLRAEPTLAPAHFNLGNVLVRIGQDAQAETEYRRAIALSPLDDATYLALAALYEKQGRLAEALRVYRTIVGLQPLSANGEFRLGVLALKMGNVGEGVHTLEIAAKLQPRSSLVHAELGHAYGATGATARGRQELALALQLDPKNTQAQKYLKELR